MLLEDFNIFLKYSWYKDTRFGYEITNLFLNDVKYPILIYRRSK